MRIFRPGSPFVAWVAACAIVFAVVQALDPKVWYSADVLGTARFVAALAESVVGAFLGAAIGAVVGAIAALAPDSSKVDPRRVGEAAAARTTRFVLIAILMGGAIGGYQLATTSERASFLACTAVKDDLTSAEAALRNGNFGDTIAKTSDALARQHVCDGSYGGPAVTAALLTLRGGAYYQTELLPKKSTDDFARARRVIGACKTPVTSEVAALCGTYTALLDRYATEHYCTDARATANSAYNARYHDPQLARDLAQRAIATAGKCKNGLAYAYRGFALAERGQAELALGESAAGNKTLREARTLLERCENQLHAIGATSGLVGECIAARKTVVAALAGAPAP